MKYYKIEMSNGYCGCDETFVSCGETEPTTQECLDAYPYTEGFAGFDPYDPEDCDDPSDYEQEILNNIFVSEITKEQYDEFIEDGFSEI